MANNVGVFVKRSVSGPLAFGPDPGTSVFLAVLAERGPVNVPLLITSFSRFKQTFGGALNATTGYSTGYHVAKLMFDKGTTRMWVTRIVGVNALAARVNLVDRAGAPLPTLAVKAKGEGVWANTYKAKIEDGTNTDTFKLSILDPSGNVVDREVFDNLSMNDASYERVKNLSTLVDIEEIASATVGADKRPATGEFLLNVTQAGVDDHAPTAAVIVGTETLGVKSGLKVFRDQRYGLGMLLASDLDLDTLVRSEMSAQIESFHIPMFSGPAASATPTGALADVVTARSEAGGGYYYPRALVLDEITQNIKKIPVHGHVVADGLKSLIKEGPGKAWAGSEFNINFVLGLETQANGQPLVDSATAELLVAAGINPIYDRNLKGPKVWGARSTANNTAWKYLHTGYIWALIASRVQTALDELVYDRADPNFFSTVQLGVTNFMIDLHNAGAFNGTVPTGNEQPDGSVHAFAVQCSEDLMSALDKTNGIVRVEIWFKDALTAETIEVNVSKRNQE